MSRVTARSTFQNYVYSKGNPPLFELLPQREENSYDTDYSLTRSDIVRNPPNSLGWRNASPYNADLSEIDFWKGTLDRTYYDYTGIKRYVEQFTGPLSGKVGLANVRIPQDLKDPPSGLTQRAEVKALLKARDQKVNIALAFAEREKSVAMIASRVTQLYQAYAKARKGNFKAAAVALGIGGSKRNARTWLELQYGWLPLLSDIHGAYDEITRKARANGLLINVTSQVSEPVARTLDYSSAPRTEIYTMKGVHSAKVSLWYTVEYETLQAASRVGLTNPAEIAWELVPWSFVVDWLIPVGDVIGAMSATTGLTFKSGTLTNYSKVDLTGHAKFFGTRYPSLDREDDIGQAACSESYMKMRRTTYNASPVPSFYVKNPFSVGHGLNALALLRGLIKPR